MKKVAFVFSGMGSLLSTVKKCIKELEIPSKVSLIITNNIDYDLSMLDEDDRSIFYCVDHRKFKIREQFENKLTQLIMKYEIDLVVLGGFRRILSENFVQRFGKITINTHPSLLPAFPGDKAQLRAIKKGVRITGATVHFINNEVDQGPIITQAAVEVSPEYNETDLKEAIIKVERRALERAITLFLQGKLSVKNNIVVIKKGCERDLFV